MHWARGVKSDSFERSVPAEAAGALSGGEGSGRRAKSEGDGYGGRARQGQRLARDSGATDQSLPSKLLDKISKRILAEVDRVGLLC